VNEIMKKETDELEELKKAVGGEFREPGNGLVVGAGEAAV